MPLREELKGRYMNTGLFQLRPWQDAPDLVVGFADITTDPIGQVVASLQVWMPIGYGHDT